MRHFSSPQAVVQHLLRVSTSLTLAILPLSRGAGRAALRDVCLTVLLGAFSGLDAALPPDAISRFLAQQIAQNLQVLRAVSGVAAPEFRFCDKIGRGKIGVENQNEFEISTFYFCAFPASLKVERSPFQNLEFEAQENAREHALEFARIQAFFGVKSADFEAESAVRASRLYELERVARGVSRLLGGAHEHVLAAAELLLRCYIEGGKFDALVE
ncbi:hypothetical protein SS50377_24041 [Spironucleus salmonicida]|uniref:Uncharacterized protein n=1 Tax=Spironucleus salmonicida TaxID=348837 RepID=V6LQX0_9EUKA|nr:hypothetical protein SS50377_24041 [Spironucleus salmonicida]|eukprot:EST47072.1 Hypothetical protein SS50377_12883 [Spironucleus salmonicida]